MGNKILVFNGDKARLQKEFNCSQPTVCIALNGKETTALHIKIREKALEMGGTEVMPVKRVYEIVQESEEPVSQELRATEFIKSKNQLNEQA